MKPRCGINPISNGWLTLLDKYFILSTRGPLGYLLDTAIKCFRAIRVGIIIAEKMAVEKLQFH